jgi:predicted Zn-dependent protease
MPRRPAKDGGHTAFTDHRISRHPNETQEASANTELIAWREPPPELRDRNLALALVTLGMQDHDSSRVIRGFKTLNRLDPRMQNDAAVLTALGSILLTAKESEAATKEFREALALRPGYAPYEVNLATALLASDNRPEAIRHLEHALELDPLLQQAVSLLAPAYRAEGQSTKASEMMARYRAAMGFTGADRNP